MRFLVTIALFSSLGLSCWAHPAFQSNGSENDDSGLMLALLQTNPELAVNLGPLLIFRTVSNYYANMQGGGGGVNDADAICQTEAIAAAYPGTFKALLGTQTNAVVPRYVCLNANCTPSDPSDYMNWVLGANRTYLRAEDMAPIGTTTALRIFEFPLLNPFSTATGSPWHWAGVHGSWRPMSGPGGVGYPQNDANGWTAMSSGWLAFSDATSVQAIDTGTTAGWNNSNLHLICVQQ